MTDNKPIPIQYFKRMYEFFGKYVLCMVISFPIMFFAAWFEFYLGSAVATVFMFLAFSIFFCKISYNKRLDYGDVRRNFIQSLSGDKFSVLTEIKNIFKKDYRTLIAETLAFGTYSFVFVALMFVYEGGFKAGILIFFAVIISFVVLNVTVWLAVEKNG